jgi:hypothetical protein
MQRILFIFACCIVCTVASPARDSGDGKPSADSASSSFASLMPPPGDLKSLLAPPSPHLMSALGINLLISTNGYGLGGFYRHEFSDEYAGIIDLSISETEDDQAESFYDPYTGLETTPGEVNRFLLFPLYAGVEKRLFKDDIVDNFRPYIMGAVGPTMIYSFPSNEDFFTALGQGHSNYTFGGFIGGGAYFGSQRSNVMGVNFRYYFIPYPPGIESFDSGTQITNKTQFGGFYISFTFGTAW